MKLCSRQLLTSVHTPRRHEARAPRSSRRRPTSANQTVSLATSGEKEGVCISLSFSLFPSHSRSPSPCKRVCLTHDQGRTYKSNRRRWRKTRRHRSRRELQLSVSMVSTWFLRAMFLARVFEYNFFAPALNYSLDIILPHAHLSRVPSTHRSEPETRLYLRFTCLAAKFLV